MKKWRWQIGTAVAALVMVAGAGTVLAHGGGPGCGKHGEGHGKWLQARLTAQLEEALAQAKATPAQQAAVLAEKDALLQAMHDGHGDRRGLHQAMIGLLTADKLDAKAVAELRDQHVARHSQMARRLAEALQRVHGQFSADQRKALVAYAQAELPAAGRGGWRGRMMKHRVESKVDSALDDLQATPQQRKAVAAVRDRLVQAFEAQHTARRAHLDQALALFAQDRLDARQIDALLQQQETRSRGLADGVAKGFAEVHAALTPAQRAQLAQRLQKHGSERHHGRGR